MDRLLTTRTAIVTTLNEYAQLHRRDRVETVALCDPTTDNYLLLNVGWKHNQRIHDIVVHLRIINNQIQVEWNGTDTLIDDLIDRGIPATDFITPQLEPQPAERA